MATSPEEIAKHKKAYWIVFGLLIVCTCVTITLGKHPWFDFGLPGADWKDVVVGLLVACVKASLVALIFMHLNHEKAIVYKFLLFTVFFFMGLMCLTMFAWSDPIREAFTTINTMGFEGLK